MDSSASKELKRLLGDGNVRTGARALAPYFAVPVKDSALMVVTPETPNQLSDAAAFAHQNEIPLYSVRRRFIEDAGLASKEGILVDLSKMNRIKKIDAANLVAHVYGGVTFEQLQAELDKEGQRLLFPVAGLSPSVLRSYVDRDMLMGSGGYRHPHVSVFHAMLADGEVWVSGSQQLADEGHADFREDQGPQFSQFFGASEDIFGIPYYGLVYTYPNRQERRLVAVGFDDLEPAKDLIYKVSRAEWCFEAFCANDRYLSVVLARGDSSKVPALRKKLNPWTAVITMEHYTELVELWERYTREAAKELGGKQLRGQMPELIETNLKRPWYVYDRDFFLGRCRHVFGFQHFGGVPETFEALEGAVAEAGLKPDELGKVVVPTYFGGAAYCEADIYYNPGDPAASSAAETGYLKAFEALLDTRALVDKPTGPVAEMVFSRTDPSYVNMIRTFKRTVDPRGNLNPDQLLEGV